jgi:hypothetical protein
VVAARRELQLPHGGADELLAGLVEAADVADLGRAHIGIQHDAVVAEPVVLPLAGGLDAFAHAG